MPIYQYTCKRCGEKSEARRRLADRDSSIVCSSCGAKCVRDLFPGAYVGRSSKVSTVTHSEPPRARRGELVAPAGQGTAIELGGSGPWKIENVEISNCDRGVVLPEGSQLPLRKVDFRNVRMPIEIKRKRPVR